ncbi:galactose mutarotase [Mucilaginibacter daejeonensis]|uniref:aldose epimerase family protein n=1 Tax=Mucilaginibacter daejeonensis TaxID=398049 RepID=UPI001D17384C|nr:aldose epimerase family protein [Mucilaginibacter daejeonensis]UEG51983.1 galactose mutarotase [Mucilaginibacter daejeonensis]
MKNRTFYAAMLAAGMLSVSACNQSSNKQTSNMTDSTSATSLPAASAFEKTIDGKQTKLFVLKNSKGAEAAITNYGGRLVSLLVPDKAGKLVDVVVGPANIDDFSARTNYYGATIGRYGNRIGKGKFTLEGKEYNLPINNGQNSLHGGTEGFDKKVWDAKQVDDHTLQLSYTSADGEQGYPGTLKTTVTYTLNDDNALKIDYTATTDKPTVVNMTNHTFFNLNGGKGSILKHTLVLDADNITPVDTTLIPTGQLLPVQNTPFDFRKATEIGSRIGEGHEQLLAGKGYDHNYVLNKHTIETPIATAQGDETGIVMEVFTDEPGIQFYSGNFMKGENKVKTGGNDDQRTAFALETQHYPDSPNKPSFPSTELKPGQTYKTTTIYKFSAK